MKKELQITGCKDGEASNGNNYTTFKTNAGSITLFDQVLIKQLKQVQHDEIAVCEVEENPKGDKIYYNITKLIELKHNDGFNVTTEKVNPITAGRQLGKTESTETYARTMSPNNNKDLQIIRQCCIKASASLVNPNGTTKEITAQAIAIAEEFTKWVLR